MQKNQKTLLRPWRRGFALKQKEVATLLGKRSTTHISRVESGQRVPNLEVAIAYEVLTGESIKFLFPSLYQKTQERILSNAEKFYERVSDGSGISTKRKCELLEEIIIRLKITK